ncbi:DUF4345 family protein [Hyphomonas sp.]|jgi:hypothetical protein|uniref:DUF4345 family protein n=1 Tax=Hyphomonas sp. TaxID=87 RepID=UPI000C4BC388|nr:hypothetical protein [Hyphomonadaceae bacterium]MBA28905.1 hypothetical protein [Hyphomonadaceae bacterium]MBL4878854.1 hypothetical protein [Hyphomonas sp.]|tara:strand:- start:492 stop:911 length:420 start_codon:yes stop_codon:yes gene_type:complete
MNIGEIISLVTLLFGAVLGLSAMFSPAWASKIVRLVEDPDPLRPGGYSEFRATYGGLFLFSHLMTAVLILNLGSAEPDILTTLVVLPLAAGWIGAGIGRLMSLVFDRTKNREAGLIPVWIPMEIILGLAIAAPFLQFLF